MKICLIGSTRFMDLYREWNRRLTLAGHVVYTVATISSSAAAQHIKAEAFITDDQKETLDLVHLRKIQESDAIVLITDQTNYVGFSTKRELKWARMLRKIRYTVLNEKDMDFLCSMIDGDPEEGIPV